MRKPLIIAHKGASYELPGNTLPAIQKAIKDRADVIEVDLRRTKDGEIILSHNECKLTLAELKEGYKLHKMPFRPPTLEEVFEKVPKSTVFYLDLKELGMTDEIKKIARQAHMNEVWYSNKESLIFAYTPLLYYYPFVPVTIHKVGHGAMPMFNPERACLHYYENIPSMITISHKLGRKVFVWGVNLEREMKKWIELGADGIITDRPGVLNKIINNPMTNSNTTNDQ